MQSAKLNTADLEKRHTQYDTLEHFLRSREKEGAEDMQSPKSIIIKKVLRVNLKLEYRHIRADDAGKKVAVHKKSRHHQL